MNYMNYFNATGRFQSMANALHRVIRENPELLEQSNKNKELKSFAKASIAYYDLFNNGLGNTNRSFGQLFFSVVEYKYPNGDLHENIFTDATKRMDEYVSAAYTEYFNARLAASK